MSGTIDLGPANPRISPLIKLSRWTFLVGGIMWGLHRYRVNKETEDAHRDYVALMKPLWDAEEGAKKAKAIREELLYLAKETQTPIPPDF